MEVISNKKQAAAHLTHLIIFVPEADCLLELANKDEYCRILLTVVKQAKSMNFLSFCN